MRAVVWIVFFMLGVSASLPSSAQVDLFKPLIEPDFAVPDLSAQAVILEETFAALAARLEAMEGRQQLEGIDARLDELFLPERPDEFRRHYALELGLARDPDDLELWQRLAESYLEKGRLDDARAAAHRVFQQSRLRIQQAAALVTMAEAALAEGEVRLALNLYKKSLDFDKDPDAAHRFAGLMERYDLKVKDIAVDAERSTPSACVIFSGTLQRPLEAEDYVGVEPAEDVDIAARGAQICVTGLRHGGAYTLVIRPGVPAANGARLYGEAKRRFTVPDRAERISFGRGAYVLPKSTGETVPLTSVSRTAPRL